MGRNSVKPCAEGLSSKVLYYPFEKEAGLTVKLPAFVAAISSIELMVAMAVVAIAIFARIEL